MSEIIPAILVVSKVTYGAVIGKKDYYYYKCYYGDKSLLVPYKVDYKQFNKNFINKYVLVKHIDSFNEPRGQIIETLGPVTDIQAYKKWLIATITYKWQTMPLTIPKNNPFIANTHDEPVYTIDPKGSTDLDDAFSIKKCHCDNITLSIMIANVPMACEIGAKVGAVSTIYTVDKPGRGIVHMLGKNVSKYSLLADGTEKYVLCLDVIVGPKGPKGPTGHKLYNKKVRITDNFNYETMNETVKDLIDITNNLNKYKRFINEDICDSHKAIEYIMIYFSAYCAQVLKDNNTGIFRTVENAKNADNTENNNETDRTDRTDRTDEILSNFLEHWEKSAMYTKEPIVNKQFNVLYAHITSPIRRFVDCVNMYFINAILDGSDFMHITDELVNIINEQNKFIKKIQTSINMLTILKEFPEAVYNGYVINVLKNTDKIIYTIYIPDISLVTEYKCYEDTGLNLYNLYNFKFYLFENKNNFKQKVRIMIY